MNILSRIKNPEKRPRQVDRHLNVPLLPILAVIFLVLNIITGYRGWLVFALGTGGAWLVAWLWVRSLERNLHLERKIHLAWATVGESVPEQIKLVNHGWFPAMWVEISDDTSNLEKPLRLVSDVNRHAVRNRQFSHLFRRRGLYSLGPTRIRTGDPLGIYTSTLHDEHTSTILVTPPLLPLPQLRVPAGGWAGDERRRKAAVMRDISDVGLRNYVPGDSLRRIHWRASAHFDQLIVRQLEASSSRDWWIIADLDRSSQVGAGENSTLELSIILAASLAMRGLREKRKIGLLLAGPKLERIEPSADPAQRWRLLRSLAMAQAGERPLADLLSLLHPQQPASTILVTSSSSLDWVAAAARQRRGGGMLVLLVEAKDFGDAPEQAGVKKTLIRSGVRFVSIPGSLLKEAYSSREQRRNLKAGEVEPRKLYLQHGRSSWLNMR